MIKDKNEEVKETFKKFCQAPSDSDLKVIEQTKHWLESIVIGLNFCPFAKKPFKDDAIRYVPINSKKQKNVFEALLVECQLLEASKAIDTSLLILPHGFDDFYAMPFSQNDINIVVEKV